MEEFIKKVFEWDVVNWSRALQSWEQKTDMQRGLGLELGGRRGGLSLWLANNGYQVCCSDLENPEAIAAPLHRKYQLSDKITYQAINATDIPYENHFDVIAFKSILGGIGRSNQMALQQQTIDQARKALKKGGVLLFAENLTGSPVHQFFRKKFVKWGDSWRYLSLREMETFLSGFSAYDIQTTGFAGTFGRTEGQRRLLGKADQLLLDHLVPKSWHYICYGWAVK